VTDIDIDKLEQLRSAATQGPFVHVTPPPGYSSGFIGYYVEHEGRRLRGEFPACDADDVYTVELLNAAPALIAEVRRLRSENERLQMQLAACGVLASCNTSDSLERHRQMHPDFLGASVHAVIEAAQREIKLLAEVRRLRAIEAAARSYMACAHAGPWEQFTSSLASLEAALAAKEEK
jgi:hypothetical protein